MLAADPRRGGRAGFRRPVGRADDTGSARRCGWSVEGATGATPDDVATAEVPLDDTMAAGDMAVLTGDEQSQLPPFGTHEATQTVTFGGAGCIVALAVDESSHVEVEVSGMPGGDYCAVAVRIAEMIEPDLP